MEGTWGGGGWILKLQLLGDLPRKDATPKVPISRGVLIDGPLQVEVPVTELTCISIYHVQLHARWIRGLQDTSRWFLGGGQSSSWRCPAAPSRSSGRFHSGIWTQTVDGRSQWRRTPETKPTASSHSGRTLSYLVVSACPNLDQDAFAETSGHQGFGHPAGSIGSRAVDLCVVLSWEGSPSVGTPAPVSVNYDLTPSQTSVALKEPNQTLLNISTCLKTAAARLTWGPPMTKRPLGCRW